MALQSSTAAPGIQGIAVATRPLEAHGRPTSIVIPKNDTARSEAPLILIAEDHPDSRDALCTLLEVYGYRVATASDGRRAVEKALALQPDLILMDIMMPEMDGFEATRQLRSHPTFRQSPIVALTAMEGARDQVLAAGCNDYIPKPIDVSTFLARIRHWIEVGKPAAS